MASYPGLTEDAFWLQVDDSLDQNSKRCETQAELDQFYNYIYQEDIEAHGDPASTAHQTAEFNESGTTSWIAVMRKYSANVLLIPNYFLRLRARRDPRRAGSALVQWNLKVTQLRQRFNLYIFYHYME
ncbi:hypothetical protein MVEN_00131100 [Mycena venus]|uniref:Uncharacterized protein n=1 Tax=Mycena venus TaxID=2733690 RepID=A0A8H6Z4Z7_9AGAR|nr:hypothetical protein MVEN_00131100 [Mycena venus]